MCKKRFVQGHSSKGRLLSATPIAKISASHKGLHHSEETIAKMSAAHIGKSASLETRKLMSESHIGKNPWNKGKKVEGTEKKSNLCQCGCGGICRRSFVQGHNKLGKKLSANLKQTMSIAQRNRYKERDDEIIKNIMKNSGKKRFPYVSTDGTIIKMRSTWEASYAEHLDVLGIIWQYEPKGFKLSNGKRYFPDFFLPELNEWHEIKGYLASYAKIKMNLFQKEYPSEKLRIIRNILDFN